MVNRYLKAFFLTLLILVIGLSAISFLDQSRISGISDSLEENALDLEASQQLFLYESVFGGDSLCGVLGRRIEQQKSESIAILKQIETAEANSLFGNTGLLKKRFLLQNIELYLLVKKTQKECGSREITPVLYFYPDSFFCAECASQAKILDSVVSKCTNARVFAFPTDLGVPVIDLLSAEYAIKTHPSLVVNEEKLEGIVPEARLLEELRCRQ